MAPKSSKTAALTKTKTPPQKSKSGIQQQNKPLGKVDYPLLYKIAERALYYSTQMIHLANNRDDIQKGDPKVGGHPAACASLTHIMGALHLIVREPQDHIAVKPHGSPMDHSYHRLMGLFYHQDGTKFTDEEAKAVMWNLRKFSDPESPEHTPVFQSYHATWDPDSFNYFPSGTVGIPPVVSAYMGLAYRFAEHHGFEIPKNAHFWSVMGDSEFREGSLHECMPDVAERHLSNVTWIVDYNRQNLDGARIKSDDLTGTDADRIERLGKANGWDVINLRHGKKRQDFFSKTGGELLKNIFEKHLTDFEFQALLMSKDGAGARKRFIELEPGLDRLLSPLKDSDVQALVEDVGGHDLEILAEAYTACRTAKRPTLIIAHTIKGWHLKMQAAAGNHSALPDDEEVDQLREKQNIPADDIFKNFLPETEEAKYCRTRGEYMHAGIISQRELKARNIEKSLRQLDAVGGLPDSFNIDLKFVPWANTQWMWGQLAAKMIRVANAGTVHETDHQKKQIMSENDERWKAAADYVVTMAPDVGTSTNLNPSMDGKVYAPETKDYESRYHVKDARRPNLVPLEREQHRHLRFEIEEANAMSCAGAFGKLKDLLGIPVMPFMSIYDFFIKRALDQLFYNVYWKSSFILVGTPSGVSLSPEGAQHSWKSDLQIPNLVTWEPAFTAEMDWILADSVRRHMTSDNKGRESVLIRAVTMGIEQKLFLDSLQTQKRFEGLEKEAILETTKQDALRGGYWLLNYEGYPGYCPGDNVVTVFAMGTLVPEAVKASRDLLDSGIYANVIVVTSNDLLLGNQAYTDGYQHLKHGLNVNGNLYVTPNKTIGVGGHSSGNTEMSTLVNAGEFLSLRAARIPIVSSHDGEPGLLDNIGSIVGVQHICLAIRKHSKSGRPVDVFNYHHINADSIKTAVNEALEQSASEEIMVDPRALNNSRDQT